MIKYILSISRLKCYFVMVSVALFSVNCTSRNEQSVNTQISNSNTKPSAAIKFETNSYDFNKIDAGQKVAHSYTFKNIGREPLIISDVFTSCGCTAPSYPKKPVLPGEKSSIDIVFDSSGQHGVQQKSITIISNTDPSTTEIYLTGEVISQKY